MAFKLDVTEMPLQHRKLYELIIKETGGNISSFSRQVGCSQQMLDKCFKKNSEGQYQAIYPSVKNAIIAKYGFDESWFHIEDSEIIAPKNDEPENDYLSIIKNLIKINEKNAQANLLNAEANNRNAQSIESLLKMINKNDNL